ncbi:hypothetical protein BCR44DRAFT_1083411 [Catenaria anguillulae PL171]|uniref:MI domain-containing protein n=1 Tax=Catenaria anguillulae PL171 TaxID=765915 RepID=A0A1Y2HNN4_9FUNG|nr:hypothetical protein BCR44DRAFT_1083411 [Catenaria anguillulae PL171]
MSPVDAPLASAGTSSSASLLSRTGGAYIPPAKLRALQAQITDKASEAYQRMSWEALKKSINGLINKANTANIKHIIPELINENLIRGRGLFCRSMIKSQAAALPFTPVYAAVTAVLNTKFPQLGELLVTRLIMQFRRAYRRNDKAACLAVTQFLAHLVNQRVAHEIVVLQILTLLLERPTDDAVEVAVGLMRQVGAYLTDAQPRALNAVFDRFRTILHEAKITVRTQYMIEVLFQVRKDKFKDNPPVAQELDLVEEDDQITHMLGLDEEELDAQDGTNVFKFDPEFLESERKYAQIKREILGSDDEDDGESGSASDDEDDSGSGSGSDDESDEDETAGQTPGASSAGAGDMIDETGADVMALRKRIYLIIMSSLDFEECIHKLMRVSIAPGQEMELVNMVIDCAAQERTYKRFYGNMAERLCKMNRVWADLFGRAFAEKYAVIHRYETTQLRNVARVFAHVLAADAVSWAVLECVVLTEEATTSSSRIFVKILFQEVMQEMGLPAMVARLTEDVFLQPAFQGLFPRDNVRNTRFAINYWTSIGFGVVTKDLREWLANAPPAVPPPHMQNRTTSDSSSDSSSGSDSDSDSDSDSSSSASDSDSSDDGRYARNRRGRSYSRSRSPPRHTRGRSRSRSPPRRRSPSYSRSPSPRRHQARGRSPSPPRSMSPPPQRGARLPLESPAGSDMRGRRPMSRSRSRSRSRSPTASRRATRYTPRSPSPPRGRGRSPPTRSLSPPPMVRGRSRSPPRSRYRSRSRTPPMARRARYDDSRSRSRSPPAGPARGRPVNGRSSRHRSNSPSRSHGSAPRSRSRSWSRSRSPPHRRFESRSRSPVARRGRYQSPSRSRSRSPIPRRRYDSRSRSRSRSPIPRRRYGSRSPSRSPSASPVGRRGRSVSPPVRQAERRVRPRSRSPGSISPEREGGAAKRRRYD